MKMQRPLVEQAHHTLRQASDDRCYPSYIRHSQCRFVTALRMLFARYVVALRPLSMIASLAILLVTCGLVACATLPGDDSSVSADLTIMVYMTGSSLETQAGAASVDLQDMLDHLPQERSSSKDGSLQVLVMASGAKEWRRSDVAADKTNIYRLTRQGLEVAAERPLANMGDSSTLLDLLQFGHDHYPARRYALLLWDHGAGPMVGVCFDELYEEGQSMDGLTLQELSTALSDSPFSGEQKLDWIGFDACLMASLETANAVAPHARYLIASQETEPTDGWDYGFMAQAASLTAEQTASRIANDYLEEYGDALVDLTLSCIDLSKVEQIEQEMDKVFGSLEVSPQTYATFADARAQTRSMARTKPFSYDMIDLQDLLTVYQDSGIANTGPVLDALENAVVLNRSNHDGRNGLSIYYPFENKLRYTSPWSVRSDALYSSSSGYKRFIDRVSAIWMGEALANWNAPHTPSQSEDDPSLISMEISEEQAAQLADVRLVVLEEPVPGQYIFVYATDDVTVTPQGTIWCKYNHDALFLIGEEGAPVTGALYYEQYDDAIVLPAAMYNLSPRASMGPNVQIAFLPDATGSLRQVDISELDEFGVLASRPSFGLEDYDVVQFGVWTCKPSFNEDGTCKGVAEWEHGSLYTGYEMHGDDTLTPMFLHMSDSEPRYALFEMTDLQGNTICSDLFELPNSNRLTLPVEAFIFVDTDQADVELMKAELVFGDTPSLQFDLKATNHGAEQIHVRIGNIVFDETPLESDVVGGTCILGPRETKEWRLFVQADQLEALGLSYINMFGFEAWCERDYEQVVETKAVSIPLQVDLRGLSVQEPSRI